MVSKRGVLGAGLCRAEWLYYYTIGGYALSLDGDTKVEFSPSSYHGTKAPLYTFFLYIPFAFDRSGYPQQDERAGTNA